MAFFDAVVPGGPGRVSTRVIAGLLLGFAGTILLVGASPAAILSADLRGPLALTGASASWAFGSVYYKRQHPTASPYVAASVQMLAGGAVVTALGLALGEGPRVHLSTTGIEAMAYLVVFGSLVGYSAYAYALKHAPATIVGTYSYVNPVIAVLLGWLLLGEAVTPRTFLAMALILGAVVWIQFSHTLTAFRRSPAPSSAD